MFFLVCRFGGFWGLSVKFIFWNLGEIWGYCGEVF